MTNEEALRAEVTRAREALAAAERQLEAFGESTMRLLRRAEAAEARVISQSEARIDKPAPRPLSTLNRYAITAHHSVACSAPRVVMLRPPFPIPDGTAAEMTPDDALALAAWLIIAAELAGSDEPLEVVRLTVQAIRSV